MRKFEKALDVTRAILQITVGILILLSVWKAEDKEEKGAAQ